MSLYGVGFLALFFSLPAFSGVKFTVIQTSDIHSHFISRENAFGLGGLARVTHKVNEIRSQRENTLFLDAGDWTEGTMFFTMDSGESTQRILEAMNYDALVLGNHDWLIGPQELYNTFKRAQFATPVLSANMDMKKIPELKEYIKPYFIKEFQGVKVGVLGLSTFEIFYEMFLAPAKMKDPSSVVKKYVKHLREKEKCDVVLLLTHIGIEEDQKIAKNVSGIDAIIGGHTHILLKKPSCVRGEGVFCHGGTPITHVGKWGHYVGQLEFEFENGKAQLNDYILHQMDSTVPEDPTIKGLVDGSIKKLEDKFGNVFDDKVFYSEVDLPIKNHANDNVLANWAVDAIREKAGADLALDIPYYSARDLWRGYSSTYDIFNFYPHVYNPGTDTSWTIKKAYIGGIKLKLLLSLVYKFGLPLKQSGGQFILDSKALNPLKSAFVDGRKISSFRTYEVAGTDGVMMVFSYLKSKGLDLGIHVEDTKIEAWRVITDFLIKKSPVLRGDIKWDGRTRTLQPDLQIRAEEINQRQDDSGSYVDVTVRNAGYTDLNSVTDLNIQFTETYTDGLFAGDHEIELNNLPTLTSGKILTMQVPVLKAGESKVLTLKLETEGLSGRYPILFQAGYAEGEVDNSNNFVETFVDVK